MIKLMKSSFYKGKEVKKKLARFILDSDMYSMGKECATFETSFAKKQGCKHALFVSSGSTANLVIIQSLLNSGKLKKGDKVAVSSLTWSTNIMPIIQLGLIPVVLDCELENLNVSSKILKTLLDKNEVQALFLTNVLGFCADIRQIKQLCEQRKIVFIEDNCESLGSKSGGNLLGNFGLASTFSFFIGHHLSTIEGGMICTDDTDLYEKLVMARAHGWDRNLLPKRQQQIRKENGIDDFFAKYTFYDLAYNARPTEISGLIGNSQIGYWDEIITKREQNFIKFHQTIKSNDELIPLDVSNMEIVSNFSMPVVCKNIDVLKKYKKRFDDAKVEIRPIIAGDMTKQPFFKKYVKDFGICKNADFVHKNGFYFPNNPELTSEEMDTITSLLRK